MVGGRFELAMEPTAIGLVSLNGFTQLKGAQFPVKSTPSINQPSITCASDINWYETVTELNVIINAQLTKVVLRNTRSFSS